MKTKNNSTADLLIEIGTEELPPKNLKKLNDAFVNEIKKGILDAGLTFENEHTVGFASPRRLAVLVKNLSLKQADRIIVKRGPAKNAAFDSSGNPTKAALGFAESCGVTIDSISYQETDKGAWLVYEQKEPGLATEELIPKIVLQALNNLPAPRRMRWGNHDFSFIRPVHWVVLLLNDKIIPAELFGIRSDKKTIGHRFHHPEPIEISSPEKYEATLKNAGYVIASFEKRRAAIKEQLDSYQTSNRSVFINDDLLDEVTGLVEWPVVLLGKFDKEFLKIPKEALISAMQVHQKCFPMLDETGNLLETFLITSNIASKDPNAVIKGNESVMQARLADAAFYYRIDKEIPLEMLRENLKNVVFQAGLGTLWDKSERMAALSNSIAKKMGANDSNTERAATLCKADLLTQMVGEFPELQGIMGRYYASDKEAVEVAKAIEEHYHPRFAQDTLPISLEGSALAITDRIDSLVGIFGLGKVPTGDKDPFALRRQALGITRILIEKNLNLDLYELLEESREIYKGHKIIIKDEFLEKAKEFLYNRLLNYCLENGFFGNVVTAVKSRSPLDSIEEGRYPLNFYLRCIALNDFVKNPSMKEKLEALIAANKRVKNILSKTSITKNDIDDKLLKETAEIQLAKCILDKEKEITPLLEKMDFTKALLVLSELREPIDQFFTDVMVMVEDQALRDNRLQLLNRLRNLFLQIADISLL